MKKVLLFLGIVSVCSFANAQSTTFGVKAGANFFQFGGDDGKDLEAQKMKIGFNVGGFANIAFSEQFSFQPELLFSNQGTLQKEGDDKVVWNLNYINIPLMVQYNASGFYAETGPEVGFLISAKAKYDMGGDSESVDIKEQFKGFNFGWGLGLGYKLQNNLGIGARYVLGLANIIDSDDAKVTQNGFHVGLFYTLGGK